ncbi:MAG: DUF4286 family protein [Tannerellaceae bacterium]|nr:DUF4286 family protein [Tannerellaceae bacterium]MCD8044632.1 DUF4286 family protein [Tannerellaceae bacterium]
MIVYNITFHVDKEVLDDYLAYMKNEFIPRAASCGFLHRPCLRKVMYTPEEEGASYAVQFHVKNVETLNLWLEQEGKNMHAELTGKFGNKIAGFTTLLEEIDWEQE